MPVTITTADAPRLPIAIADDSPAMREGLARLIGDECDFLVVNSAATAGELRRLVKAQPPRVLVMDLMLGDADGLALIKELRELAPALRIVVFTAQPEDVYGARCIEAGAHGFVAKRDAVGTLFRAIRETAAGAIVVPAGVSNRLLGAAAARPQPADGLAGALTNRELQVFRLVGLGQPTREIAAALGISIKTVESHRENIKNKLGLQSHEQLVARAAQWLGDGAGI